jgi:hypothetical protein
VTFSSYGKRSASVPMVTPPVRTSAAQPMADSVPAKKPRPGSNTLNLAKANLVRRRSLNKQRSLLASSSKNVKT